MAGVLDEPYGQPTPLNGVAVQARPVYISCNRVRPMYPGGSVWLLRWAGLDQQGSSKTPSPGIGQADREEVGPAAYHDKVGQANHEDVNDEVIGRAYHEEI